MEYLRKIINRKNFLILLIIALAFLLRFIWIDKVPNAITGDELTYVVNAKAMVISGSDISGTWNPLAGFIFQYPAYTNPQAELPYFLLAPFVGLMGFSLFSVRIIFVLLSVLSVPLVYLIAKTLFNKNVGLLAAFIMAVNPWSIYMGRTSYESTPAAFFYLLAFYMLLAFKSKKLLLSIPVLFLAFYSYVGTKVSFLPFVLVIILFSYYFINKKKYKKEYLIVFISCLLLVIVFALSVFTTSGPSRTGELISLNAPQISSEVNYIREVSIRNSLTNIFENKPAVFLRVIFTKLYKSFSFDYLFIYGDQFYSILRHGFFYVLDALFIIMGIVATYRYRKSTFFLLASICLIGVLPQLLYSARVDNFSIHLSLMFAVLPIFVGIGIWEVANLIKNKFYFRVSLLITGGLYLLLIINFLNIYFYQFPLRGYFDFHIRLLSNYALIAGSQGKEVTVYSTAAPDTFKKYLFYSNSYNKDTYLEVRKIYKSEKFKYQNVNFLGCDNTIDPNLKNSILIYDFNCGALPKEYKHLAIPRLLDGGQSYQIYNDKICNGFDLKRYPQNVQIDDFAIEGQSAQKFCETFITAF